MIYSQNNSCPTGMRAYRLPADAPVLPTWKPAQKWKNGKGKKEDRWIYSAYTKICIISNNAVQIMKLKKIHFFLYIF